MLNMDDMDKIYCECTMAFASLGLHRIDSGLVASTLKTREYLAKGIPFIYSGEVDVFQKNPVDFCFRVPADESPIDIQSVIDFHDRLYAGESEEHLISRIRSFAEEHVSWKVTMRPVIDYIKQNAGK